MIRFAHPEWFWLLPGVSLLALLTARGGARRRRDWSALGQSGRPRGDGAGGWVLAAALLVVALARPQWGRLPGADLPPGHDVVILVDTSRSMAAEDAFPSRLGAAVELAEGLVAALGRSAGDRAGLVAFSGRAEVRCPVTENLGVVLDALHDLRPGAIQPGGTDLGAGLASALEAFGDEEPPHAGGRAVVVFSDGEDHAGRWPAAAEQFRAAGVPVHAVALGDRDAGAPVPDGRGGTLRFQGEAVRSVRQDEALRDLADATGGAFLPVGIERADLGALYRERIAPAARRLRAATESPRRAEQFGVLVAAALVAATLGARPGRRPLGALAAMLVFIGAAAPEGSPAEAVAAGSAAYARGNHAGAIAAFRRAESLAPGSPIPRFDAAAALFQLGRFDEAAAAYRAARERAGPALRMKIDFALGNTALSAGDVDGAIRSYDECLRAEVTGPAADQIRRDADENRRFALRLQRDEQDARAGDSQRPRPRPSEPSPRPSPTRPEAGEPAPKAPRAERTAEGPPPQAPGQPSPGPDPGAPTGSPRERLNDAVQRVREAGRRRLPDAPPPAGAAGEVKDW